MSKDRVLKVISQVMNVPINAVNENSSSNTLEQWDSLQHMNLMLALEEEFKVKFTDDEIVHMTSAGNIIGVLQKRS